MSSIEGRRSSGHGRRVFADGAGAREAVPERLLPTLCDPVEWSAEAGRPPKLLESPGMSATEARQIVLAARPQAAKSSWILRMEARAAFFGSIRRRFVTGGERIEVRLTCLEARLAAAVHGIDRRVMFTCIQMSDSKQEPHKGKIVIEHVSVKTEKPFGEVAAFEARLGPGRARSCCSACESVYPCPRGEIAVSIRQRICQQH
jgi:hypothetical protein